MKGWTEFLRTHSGGVEVNRLGGFLGMLGLVIFSGFEVIWLGRAFDPLAFSAGVAAIVAGTGGAVALKDRQVAAAKVIEATGSKPADPPAPAPRVQHALADDAKGDTGMPSYAQ